MMQKTNEEKKGCENSIKSESFSKMRVHLERDGEVTTFPTKLRNYNHGN